MSRGQRLALLGLAAVIAVVAVVLIRPGQGQRQPAPGQTRSPGGAAPRATGEAQPRSAPPRAPATTVRVRNGQPIGGAPEVTVKSGEVVTLAFESNRDDALHIHGYDRYVRLRADR